MRSRFMVVALGIVSLGVLCLTPSDADAQWRRGGCGQYAPVVTPYAGMPAYYPPRVVYLNPGPAYPPAPYAMSRYGQPSPAWTQPTTTVDVGMRDNVFQPATTTVLPGTTVRWTNRGTHKHTVTSANGLFDSGELAPGQGYSVTFNRPGTYAYVCTLHAQEMRGVIVVR
jgi:plastocyanin